MSANSIGIVMNGVTGRMGLNQHLVRSIVAIRQQGGVPMPDGTRLMPDQIVVGRDERKLKALAKRYGMDRVSTDLEGALSNESDTIYFDATLTQLRAANVRRAIERGKHIYCEKPLSVSTDEALDLARLADEAGVKHGVVQDKLFLPGIMKLRRLVDAGYFGRILSVRGEFGYWVFEGDLQPAQRPSWNYRSQDGGGMVVDMFPHWNYVLENLFARVEAVTAKAVTHIAERWDEHGEPYEATAEDSAYGIFELAGGTIAQINSSWSVRVNRDELVEFQVDGTEGSAVAGLFGCRVQHRANTPKAVWNPDLPETQHYRDGWLEVPDNREFDNGFKAQWEQFVRHVIEDAPNPYDFFAGARGVQLAEAGLRSSREGRRVVLEEIVP